MNAMKKLICLLLMLCAGTAAFAWGGREHRLIAYIAEAHLTPRTRQVLDRYLDQSIVEYSTWMDRYRTAPGYEITTYWHMVTIDKDGSVPPEPLRFTDVDYSSWYAPGVDFVASRGLMKGYEGTTIFGVGSALTRGELATILWRNACPDEAASYDPATAKDTTGIAGSADGMFYTADVHIYRKHLICFFS